MQYNEFDKIIKHLQRKCGTAVINFEEHGTYKMLLCDYNYYHLAITYRLSSNDYNIYLEDTCYVYKQKIGIKFWETNMKSQNDVIDFIRHKIKSIRKTK